MVHSLPPGWIFAGRRYARRLEPGYDHLKLEKLITLPLVETLRRLIDKIHSLGYSHPDRTIQITHMRLTKFSPKYIQKHALRGIQDLSIDKLVSMIHGID